MSVAYEERSGKRCTKKVKTIIISISETFVFFWCFHWPKMGMPIKTFVMLPI